MLQLWGANHLLVSLTMSLDVSYSYRGEALANVQTKKLGSSEFWHSHPLASGDVKQGSSKGEVARMTASPSQTKIKAAAERASELLASWTFDTSRDRLCSQLWQPEVKFLTPQNLHSAQASAPQPHTSRIGMKTCLPSNTLLQAKKGCGLFVFFF